MTIAEINFHLQNVWQGQPWYGKSVKEIAQGIHAEDITSKQILSHMLAWRRLVLDRVGGINRMIEIDSNEDWPDALEVRVEKVIDEIEQNNQKLIALLSDKPDSWLRNKVEGSVYNFQFLLEGIVQHDIYHAGQLAFNAKKYPD